MKARPAPTEEESTPQRQADAEYCRRVLHSPLAFHRIPPADRPPRCRET